MIKLKIPEHCNKKVEKQDVNKHQVNGKQNESQPVVLGTSWNLRVVCPHRNVM